MNPILEFRYTFTGEHIIAARTEEEAEAAAQATAERLNDIAPFTLDWKREDSQPLQKVE